MQQLHFISGLPRSGSTLLSALLAQNPRFHAGMSGPLAGLFGALLGEMSERSEFAAFLDDAKRQCVPVKAEPRTTVLPPDRSQCFEHDAFWRAPARRPAGLRII